jgi:hypothetical protein
VRTLSWIILVALAVAASVLIAGFRMGKIRSWESIYRSDGLPETLRNVPLALPFAVIGFGPVLLLLAPSALGIQIDPPVPHALEGLLLFGALANFLVCGGLFCLFLFRPPRWLEPEWLRIENDRIGYVPPSRDWFDWGVLAVGLFLLALGLGCLIVALVQFAGAA